MPADHRGREVHGGKVTDDVVRRMVSQGPDGNWRWKVSNADYAQGESSVLMNWRRPAHGGGGPLRPGHKQLNTIYPEFGARGGEVAAQGVTSTERRANIAADAMLRRIGKGDVNIDTGRPVDRSALLPIRYGYDY